MALREREAGEGKGETRGLEAGASFLSRGTLLYNLCLRMANTEPRDCCGTLHLDVR